MARGSRWFVVVVALVIFGVALSAAMLRSRMRCAGFEGPGVSSAGLPAGPAEDGLTRVVSWNIRNFPLDERPQENDLGHSRRTNICDLEDALRGLRGDILGLAEITDTRRFPPILRRAGGEKRYGLAFSRAGGRFGQHVAVAWDRDRFESIGKPVEVVEVMLGNPGLRPALAVRMKSLSGSLDLTVVQLHFKSSPSGYDTRRQQLHELAEWIEGWVEEIGDEDMIVMGDFNTTGAEGRSAEDEIAEMDLVLADVGLRRLPNPLGCTEYWEGYGPRDGVQIPSLLDHIYVRGLESIQSETVDVWLHCKRFNCEDLVSQPGAEDGTFWDVSDHCPMTFEIGVE